MLDDCVTVICWEDWGAATVDEDVGGVEGVEGGTVDDGGVVAVLLGTTTGSVVEGGTVEVCVGTVGGMVTIGRVVGGATVGAGFLIDKVTSTTVYFLGTDFPAGMLWESTVPVASSDGSLNTFPRVNSY